MINTLNLDSEAIYIVMESNDMYFNLVQSMIKLEHNAIVTENEKLLNEGVQEIVNKLRTILRNMWQKIREWFRKAIAFLIAKLPSTSEINAKRTKTINLLKERKAKMNADLNDKSNTETDAMIKKENLEKYQTDLKQLDNKYKKDISIENEIFVYMRDDIMNFIHFLKDFKSFYMQDFESYDYNVSDIMESISSKRLGKGIRTIEDFKEYLNSNKVKVVLNKSFYNSEKDTYISKYGSFDKDADMFKDLYTSINRAYKFLEDDINLIEKVSENSDNENYKKALKAYYTRKSIFDLTFQMCNIVLSNINERVISYNRISDFMLKIYEIETMYDMEKNSLEKLIKINS